MDAYPYCLKLDLFFDRETAGIVKKAVEPELGLAYETRSRTMVSAKGSMLSIAIKARDKTALRASLNSHCRSAFLSEKLRRLMVS